MITCYVQKLYFTNFSQKFWGIFSFLYTENEAQGFEPIKNGLNLINGRAETAIFCLRAIILKNMW